MIKSGLKTKEISYILGFLWADGYMYKKQNHIVMSLKKEDAITIIKLLENKVL